MKKVFLLIPFIASCAFAQHSTNGNISMVFNGEKIDLPISTISIHKGNGILLSIEAEKQDSIIQQMVTLELGLKELSSESNVEVLEDTKIEISMRDKKTNSGKELSFWFNSPSGNDKRKPEVAYYSVYKKGERMSWEINSISMKINIEDIQYKNGALYINGEFDGTFKSTLSSEGQAAEIKDCKFEIII
jgi:hypothetical protein